MVVPCKLHGKEMKRIYSAGARKGIITKNITTEISRGHGIQWGGGQGRVRGSPPGSLVLLQLYRFCFYFCHLAGIQIKAFSGKEKGSTISEENVWKSIRKFQLCSYQRGNRVAGLAHVHTTIKCSPWDAVEDVFYGAEVEKVVKSIFWSHCSSVSPDTLNYMSHKRQIPQLGE